VQQRVIVKEEFNHLVPFLLEQRDLGFGGYIFSTTLQVTIVDTKYVHGSD
jgi:hypothetical protein